MKRKYAKVDANQKSVVDALRAAGCSVRSTAALGNGFPDLLVARNNCMWLLEVKDGEKCPSARKLTPDELKFREMWKAPVFVVQNIGEALIVISKL